MEWSRGDANCGAPTNYFKKTTLLILTLHSSHQAARAVFF